MKKNLHHYWLMQVLFLNFLNIFNQFFVPVVDDNNVFIGIITRKDVILYLTNKELVENV